jgi:hypothetical protein
VIARELKRGPEWTARQVAEFDALARAYLPAAEGDTASPLPVLVGTSQS